MIEYLQSIKAVRDTEYNTHFEIKTNRYTYNDVWEYTTHTNCEDGKPYRQYTTNLTEWCKQNNVRQYV